MSQALPLPPSADVEQYRKLAKELSRACETGGEDGVRAWATGWLATLARRVDIDRNASGVLERWRKSRPDCSVTGAQLFIAREHGFASWPKFIAHVAEARNKDSEESRFEAAADAVVNGDFLLLERLLRETPKLTRRRSLREHGSTLLHYVSANGVEDYRQKTPANIVAIARLLLDSGAEVDAESHAYGGGSTALGLTATSAHPEKAGAQTELLELLIARGAKPGFVNDCLRNGRGPAAVYLAGHGAALDLEGACGVGRMDLVRALDRESRAGDRTAGFHWACEYGRVEVVEYLLGAGFDPRPHFGLHWASYGAFLEIAELLLAGGVDVDSRDSRFDATPLGWAIHAWRHQPPAGRNAEDYARMIRLLVRMGAKVEAEWLASPRVRDHAEIAAALTR